MRPKSTKCGVSSDTCDYIHDKASVGTARKCALLKVTKMPSLISCLCWVKRGAAKENPDQVSWWLVQGSQKR